MTVSPLVDDEWIKHTYDTGRSSLLPLPFMYSKRIRALLGAKRFDAVWLEKEALPWLPSGFERVFGLARVPYVLDYDDAVFHTYDQHRSALVRRWLGRKIADLMHGAALVMVGNDYLRDYAERAGASRIEWVPTVVDLNRYPAVIKRENGPFTIGWWGAPANSRHLGIVSEALVEVCRGGQARLHVIGGWKTDLPAEVSVAYTPFSAADPVEPTQQFDVGIMPLPDQPWERGKCGMKLIHYMACHLPTVASPVGANRQIVEHGVTGFLASSTQEWVDAFKALKESHALRKNMGEAGRSKIERLYSLQATAPRVANMLLALDRQRTTR